jgi:hypothetical protein
MDLTSIIKRALDRTEGVANDARAVRILEYIEIARDLTSDIGHAPEPIRTQQPQVPTPMPVAALPSFSRTPLGLMEQPPSSNLIVVPGMAEEDPLPRLTDITDLPIIRAVEAGAQVQTVAQIDEYLKRVAPTTFDVTLHDGKPVRLSRKILVQAATFPGCKEGDGTVTLSYPEKGDPDCPGYVFSSSDRQIDLQAALEEITKIAQGRYSHNTEPRKVVARPATPWRDDLSNCKGGDAEEANGAGLVSEWAANRGRAERDFLAGK